MYDNPLSEHQRESAIITWFVRMMEETEQCEEEDEERNRHNG